MCKRNAYGKCGNGLGKITVEEKCGREMWKRNVKEKCGREMCKRNTEEKCGRRNLKMGHLGAILMGVEVAKIGNICSKLRQACFQETPNRIKSERRGTLN